MRLLFDGVQSYTAMLDLVESARAEALFENFIFRNDAVERAFAAALRHRAEEGVDVRILHDPFGSLMSLRAPIGLRFHRSPPSPTPPVGASGWSSSSPATTTTRWPGSPRSTCGVRFSRRASACGAGRDRAGSTRFPLEEWRGRSGGCRWLGWAAALGRRWL